MRVDTRGDRLGRGHLRFVKEDGQKMEDKSLVTCESKSKSTFKSKFGGKTGNNDGDNYDEQGQSPTLPRAKFRVTIVGPDAQQEQALYRWFTRLLGYLWRDDYRNHFRRLNMRTKSSDSPRHFRREPGRFSPDKFGFRVQ
jgi:hypothetical protein